MQQSTIARRVAWTGTGLHGGERVAIALCPAEMRTAGTFLLIAALILALQRRDA